MHHPTTFVKPVVEHWLEHELVQWVYDWRAIRRPLAPRADVLALSYVSRPNLWMSLLTRGVEERYVEPEGQRHDDGGVAAQVVDDPLQS